MVLTGSRALALRDQTTRIGGPQPELIHGIYGFDGLAGARPTGSNNAHWWTAAGTNPRHLWFCPGSRVLALRDQTTRVGGPQPELVQGVFGSSPTPALAHAKSSERRWAGAEFDRGDSGVVRRYKNNNLKFPKHSFVQSRFPNKNNPSAKERVARRCPARRYSLSLVLNRANAASCLEFVLLRLDALLASQVLAVRA